MVEANSCSPVPVEWSGALRNLPQCLHNNHLLRWMTQRIMELIKEYIEMKVIAGTIEHYLQQPPTFKDFMFFLCGPTILHDCIYTVLINAVAGDQLMVYYLINLGV